MLLASTWSHGILCLLQDWLSLQFTACLESDKGVSCFIGQISIPEKRLGLLRLFGSLRRPQGIRLRIGSCGSGFIRLLSWYVVVLLSVYLLYSVWYRRGGQRTACVNPLFPPCGDQGSKSCLQIWWQSCLPAEPPHLLTVTFLIITTRR